jgi:membrane-bound lytic murein transglycosylase D
MTFAQKQAMNGKTAPSGPAMSFMQTAPEGDFITYTVRSGDTIWDIVKQFDNVSTSDVLQLNSISDASRIKVGQVLKIKKKS